MAGVTVTRSRRTLYVVVVDRKTGTPLGPAALKRLAADVARQVAGRTNRRAGDYVISGTRFLDPLEVDRQVVGDRRMHKATPVVKVRGDDVMRNMAVLAIARVARVASIHDYDRNLVGGRR